MSEWNPMPAPLDGKFRLYGLTVTGRGSFKRHQWFEAYYVAHDGDSLIETSGDIFSTWGLDDFEVWADAPPPPALPALKDC